MFLFGFYPQTQSTVYNKWEHNYDGDDFNKVISEW